MVLRYSGGQVGADNTAKSTFFYVDNLKVVSWYEDKLVKSYNASGKDPETLAYKNHVATSGNYAYGTNSIANNSASMFITLSSEYMATVFADDKVTAFTFDVILSIDAKLIGIYTTSVKVTLANNQSTSSTTLNEVTYYTYTLTITRDNYNTYGKDADMVIRCSGGQAGADNTIKSTFFYIDNFSVVKSETNA